MARCGCGGAQCGCAIIAGDNVDIDGTGSAANPYVVTAVTSCPEVRGCLHNGTGVAYDPATGTFSAALSGQAGNNIVVGPDGGLFVPAGAATVNVGCGLVGDGSGSAPVHVVTGTWPYACSVDTMGGGVYCDSTGALRSDPPGRASAVEDNVLTRYSNVTVPTAPTLVRTSTLNIPNPDPCRTAFAIVSTELDVNFNLPAGSGGAASIGNDEMVHLHNRGTGTATNAHVQVTKVYSVTIPPGTTRAEPLQVFVGRGGSGANFNLIQTYMRAFVFNL